MTVEILGVKGTAATVPFVQAPNAMFRDRRLSADAKCLLGYVASFSEGWKFYFPTVRGELGWGVEKLRKVMSECVAIGALRMDRDRRGDGTLGGYVLAVTWRPWATQISQEMLGIEPKTENQYVADR